MSRTDNRTRPSLPVTSEVGGEGGSFADPTVQVASREGRLDRTASDGDCETASRPIRSESVTANAADDAKSGMTKSPKEK
jgi:hypothetical protein